MHVIEMCHQHRRVIYLDIKDAGVSTVADDRAQHKGGADGDQLKLCFLLASHASLSAATCNKDNSECHLQIGSS